MCLATYWQWKLANKRARISAVIVKTIFMKHSLFLRLVLGVTILVSSPSKRHGILILVYKPSAKVIQTIMQKRKEFSFVSVRRFEKHERRNVLGRTYLTWQLSKVILWREGTGQEQRKQEPWRSTSTVKSPL